MRNKLFIPIILIFLLVISGVTAIKPIFSFRNDTWAKNYTGTVVNPANCIDGSYTTLCNAAGAGTVDYRFDAFPYLQKLQVINWLDVNSMDSSLRINLFCYNGSQDTLIFSDSNGYLSSSPTNVNVTMFNPLYRNELSVDNCRINSDGRIQYHFTFDRDAFSSAGMYDASLFIYSYGNDTENYTMKFAPNDSTSETSFFTQDISGISLYQYYNDGLFGNVQDYFGNIILNGNVLFSIPSATTKYTFDYDTAITSYDRSSDMVFMDVQKSLMNPVNTSGAFPFEEDAFNMSSIIGEGLSKNYTVDWKTGKKIPVTGDVRSSKTCKKGFCYNLTSSSSQKINFSTNYYSNESFGVDLWFKTGKSVSSAKMFEVSQWGSSLNSLSLQMSKSDAYGGDYVQISNAGCALFYPTGTANFNDTNWHNLYMYSPNNTREGFNNSVVYYDGTPVTKTNSNNVGTCFKSRGEMRAGFFTGLLDEFYILNGSWTNSTIQRMINSQCHTGYCADFGSMNETFSMGNSSHLSLSNGGTITAWVKPTFPISKYTIVDRSNGTSGEYGYSFTITNNGSMNFTINKTLAGSTGEVVANGSWSLIGVSFNSSNISFYMNGLLVSSTPNSILPLAGYSFQTSLGNRLNTSGTKFFPYVGMMDDVALYNRSLNADQMLFLYNNTYRTTALNGTYAFNFSAITPYNYLINSYSLTNLTMNNINMNFSIYDENTNARLNGVNVTMTVFGTDPLNPFGTFTGWTNYSNFSFSHLWHDTYTVQYSAQYGYTMRTMTVVLNTSSTSNSFDLFLSNLTTPVAISVRNQNNEFLEGVHVRYLKFFPLSGNYQQVGEGITNFEGKSQLQLELDTALYKFVLLYNGVIALETIPTYVYSTSIDFQINTGQNFDDYYRKLGNVWSNLSFDDSMSEFRWAYINNNANTVSACLYVYDVNPSDQILVNSSCVALSDSAIIYVKTDNVTGKTYRADAYLNLPEGDPPLDSLFAVINLVNTFGVTGVFLQFLLTLVSAFTFYFDKKLPLITVPLSLVFGSAVGLTTISVGSVVAILIMGIILYVILARQGVGQ